MPSPSPDRFAFCETTTAPPLAPWHLRRVPAGAGLNPGGGNTGLALCGRDITGGWDLPDPAVTGEALADLARLSPPGVCPRCHEAHRAALAS